MAQNKNNSGVLFRNSRKKLTVAADGTKVPANDKEAKKPDYTGNVTVEGVDYWISAWIKESQQQKGQKYFSLAFSAKPVEVEP